MFEKWTKYIIRSTIFSIILWLLMKIAGCSAFGGAGQDFQKQIDGSFNQTTITNYIHNANDLINNNGDNLK